MAKKIVARPNKKSSKAKTEPPLGKNKARVSSPARFAHSLHPGFPIVGIGASAGGLEAMEELLENMPLDTGMGFVIVTHQHPGHASMLPALLDKKTEMPVVEAADGLKVEPNHVYVCPPGVNLAILHGTLHCMPGDGEHTGAKRLESEQTDSRNRQHARSGGKELRPFPRAPRLPIDSFLRSLAQDQQERAICIILSGTGTDGTIGLKAIKGESGMAIVEQPAAARYVGMPSSAIATGLADYVLPPAEMPQQLVAYVQGPYLQGAAVAAEAPAMPVEPMQKIFVLLRQHTGHDFSGYKSNTLRRRVERRMNVHQIGKPHEYVRYLQENPAEIEALFKELLISVTNFFRDPEAWHALAAAVRKLVDSQSENSRLRAWVPGCATGEEAFSLAITLRECLDRAKRHLDAQVFGTDLDAQVIDTARVGQYPDGIAVDVSPERLERFFLRDDSTYRIRKEIREMTVFAPHNVIKDPPFTKLDILACRNLLIYLNADLQKKLLPIFHYALKPDGLLFLGPSETIGAFTDLFEPLDKAWKIYRRKEVARAVHMLPEMPAQRDLGYARASGTLAAEGDADRAQTSADKRLFPATMSISTQIERLLLSRFAPASVVVNDRGDIVYIHGRTGAYLEPAQGQPRTNVIEMAREGLQIELAAALRQCVTSGTDVVREDIRVKSNGDFVHIDLSVAKLQEPEAVRGLLLITFRPAPQVLDEAADTELSVPDSAATAGGVNVPQSSDGGPVTRITTTPSKTTPKRLPKGRGDDGEQRVEQLERELQYMRESQQTTREELETANEELRSINEELQSTNEELQSTNEELETSKEEMQSLNEELSTVNAELQSKVDDLSQSNDDMQNLLNSTDIATVFLDNELNIKRFTEHAKKLVMLRQSDVGRPLAELASNLDYKHFVADCREVLKTLESKEREVGTKDDGAYLMRIRPYRTTENIIDGLVITFVNIQQLKAAEKSAELRAFFESIVETVRHPLVVLDDAHRVVSANRCFFETFRLRPKQVMERPIFQIGEGEWDVPELRELLEGILPDNTTFENFQVDHEFGKIGRKVFLLNARRLERPSGLPGMILLAMEDVTSNYSA